jgi:hypothetical protein
MADRSRFKNNLLSRGAWRSPYFQRVDAPDRLSRFRGIIASCLGLACVAAAGVGMSRCCPGSGDSIRHSLADTLVSTIVFAPLIATQAVPLVIYWRVRQSWFPSLQGAVFMSVVLWWTYVRTPFAMLRPGPLLGTWYPYVACLLTLALVPGMFQARVEERGRHHQGAPPRPDPE